MSAIPQSVSSPSERTPGIGGIRLWFWILVFGLLGGMFGVLPREPKDVEWLLWKLLEVIGTWLVAGAAVGIMSWAKEMSVSRLQGALYGAGLCSGMAVLLHLSWWAAARSVDGWDGGLKSGAVGVVIGADVGLVMGILLRIARVTQPSSTDPLQAA